MLQTVLQGQASDERPSDINATVKIWYVCVLSVSHCEYLHIKSVHFIVSYCLLHKLSVVLYPVRSGLIAQTPNNSA